MNLLIHDLKAEDWEAVRRDYEGWRIVCDRGTIRPCVGCFGCWNKTPGQCVIHDGCEHMGALIHEADEVHVISRYTYGGFSGSVKNVFDRSLGYVLPQFEVVDGETHHRKRYEEDKPFTFVFYGSGLGEAQKESARQYVQAVCANIRGHVKAVHFRECGAARAVIPQPRGADTGKLLLLNASMRSENGNSAKLARKLNALLAGETETVALKRYLKTPSELLRLLESASTVVLCMPLYVDGLPSQLIRFMEYAEREYRGGAKRIYVLANMGLYESRQLVNLFGAVRQWCDRMGFSYCGGLGVSAGELVGILMQHIPFRLGPTAAMAKSMARLADAINKGNAVGDLYAEPCCFPRSLYIHIANTNWNVTAKKNGLRPEDLYRRPEEAISDGTGSRKEQYHED